MCGNRSRNCARLLWGRVECERLFGHVAAWLPRWLAVCAEARVG